MGAKQKVVYKRRSETIQEVKKAVSANLKVVKSKEPELEFD